MSISLCLKDEFGVFLGACTYLFQPLTYVDQGEAFRLYFGMEWLKELDMKNKIICMDAKFVVNVFLIKTGLMPKERLYEDETWSRNS